jgi:WD40 repeat protein
MKSLGAAAALAVLLWSPPAQKPPAQARLPVIAYLQGEQIFIDRGVGRPVLAYKTQEHIQSFALSSSGNQLAVVVGNHLDIGGQLRLVDVRSGRVRTLLSPIRDPENADVAIVYAAPDFSPDDRTLAYQERGQYPEDSAANDAVMNGGPIGTFDLASNTSRTFDATGDFMMLSVRWSPSGTKLLASTAGILDRAGNVSGIDFLWADDSGEERRWPGDWVNDDCFLALKNVEKGYRFYIADVKQQHVSPATLIDRLPEVLDGAGCGASVSGEFLLLALPSSYVLYDIRTMVPLKRFSARQAEMARLPAARCVPCAALTGAGRTGSEGGLVSRPAGCGQ